jgi:hypothetical protein
MQGWRLEREIERETEIGHVSLALALSLRPYWKKKKGRKRKKDIMARHYSDTPDSGGIGFLRFGGDYAAWELWGGPSAGIRKVLHFFLQK